MSFWTDLLGRGKSNPATKAMPYLEQIPGTIKPYYEPYIQQGQQAGNQFSPILGQMSQNPAQYLEQLMQGYEPSKAYGLQRDEALRAASSSAAAGGRRGTPQDMMNQARIADMLMGQDMQNWLNNVLGIQGAGLSGQQHLYDVGYGASTGLAGDLSNVLGSQAGLAFQGQSQQNKSAQDIIKSLLGAITGGAGAASGAAGLGGAGAGFSGDMAAMFGSMPAAGVALL